MLLQRRQKSGESNKEDKTNQLTHMRPRMIEPRKRATVTHVEDARRSPTRYVRARVGIIIIVLIIMMIMMIIITTMMTIIITIIE